MTLPALALLLLALAAALAWSGRRRARARADDLARAFDLDPRRVRLLGADVGGLRRPVWLRTRDILGVPDAVFESLDGGEVIVGEVKSRVARGRLRRHEWYQITLYLGAARRRYHPARVSGRVRFHDGVVPAQFDEAVFAGLIALVPDLRSELARWRRHDR